jgi:hypothetical protein
VVKLNIFFKLLVIAALVITTTIITAPAAYAQTIHYSDQIDESHMPLVSEVLNELVQNQSMASTISIPEDGNMMITFGNETPEISDDPWIVLPHNFTIENGYSYTNGKIYKPDGTELFPPP